LRHREKGQSIIIIITIKKEASAFVGGDTLGNHREQSQQSRLELGCVSAIDSSGRTISITDTPRDDGKRFVVHADEKLTAFLELEACDELT